MPKCWRISHSDAFHQALVCISLVPLSYLCKLLINRASARLLKRRSGSGVKVREKVALVEKQKE